MLYLEDYLELIEHLPQELRDRFTELRTKDLQVQNSNEQLKEKVELTFAEAAHKPDRKPEQCDYQNLLDEYQASMRIADDKVQIANNMYDIMVKLVQRLDSELEKFKLELEADHAGITEELEKRSLELDADSRLEAIINNHLNNDTSVNSINNNNRSLTSTPSLFNHNSTSKLPSGVKARRRSEQKHRHHPYNNNNLINNNNQQHISNGYNNHHGRGKLSHQDHTNSSTLPENHSKKSFNNRIQQNNNFVSSCRQQATTSPSQYFNNISGYHSSSSISAPASVAGDLNSMDASGHYGNNLLSSFGNNQSFKTNSTSNKNNNLQNISNSQFNHQHSALSAALSTNTPQPLNSVSALAMLNATSAAVAASANNQSNSNNQKISSMYIAGNHDFIDPDSPLVRQNPLAAAASQAIAATQQLQQGRRTPSLKASFAAINAAGSGLLDNHGKHVSMAKHDVSGFGANRNALAPMAPDQQAFRINGFHSGNKNQLNGSSTATNPLYISTTKSGRTSKKTAKHHNQQQRNTSHLYPDESPTSISSDNNSVFDNSESLSSTDFIETGTNFGSTSSPSSLDFSTNATQGNTTLYQRDETKYCLCRQISYGEMVACDNNDCEFEWFHYDCVNVTQPPKGKWYCPDCSRKMASNHQNQSSQALKKGSRKEKTASM